ncbi:MAG: CgeB family protein [Chitinivibrionales bacterium]
MNFVLFYHSLLSDWNHGNAHFLRGIVRELTEKGHHVRVYEPKHGWSASNLMQSHGCRPIRQFKEVYPGLTSYRYDPATIDLNKILDDADVVLVHEWNDYELVKRVGKHRFGSNYKLLFHDTHHRSVSVPEQIAGYDLSNYDGVLAFGDVVRDIYLEKGWTQKAWTWHEAADEKVFFPCAAEKKGDLVWIGNWGDEERTRELHEFLLEPVKRLSMKAKVHGVRYPEKGLEALSRSGIEFGDWLPNFNVPSVFGRYRVTVHIPRRPYVNMLPGIPTIRPFEALACGIPLVCSPWYDTENLFTSGKDYLVAGSGRQMEHYLRDIINDDDMAYELAENGRKTILSRHTCGHRVDQLLEICLTLGVQDTQLSDPKEYHMKTS